MRHKELLSHCATPTYLKLATDAVPQGKVRLCKQSFHQQPEKSRGKFSQPKHFLFMFKPLKKSLHYVLVFLSLLAILLTTHHLRMGKVPWILLHCYQDIHHQLPSEGDTGGVKRGFPNVSHSQLPLSQTEICRFASSILCFPRKCTPLNCCTMMRSAVIWQKNGSSSAFS